jgi:hypothetical protein
MDFSVRSFYSGVVFPTTPQAYQCAEHSQEACSPMLTEFLIFFLMKFVFKKFSIVSPEYLVSC